MKYFSKVGLVLASLVVLSACSDDRTGEIVQVDKIDGLWAYNGAKVEVSTSFALASSAINEDITNKLEGLTTAFKLELMENKRYILSNHTVLKDSGRYSLEAGEIIFNSKMLDTSYIENAPILFLSDGMKMTFDKTAYYSDSTRLDSLNIKDPDAMSVYNVTYDYMFIRER